MNLEKTALATKVLKKLPLLLLCGCGPRVPNVPSFTAEEARAVCREGGVRDSFIDGAFISIKAERDSGLSSLESLERAVRGCQIGCLTEFCMRDCTDCFAAIIDVVFSL